MSDPCVFCRIVRGEAQSWKVREDDATFAFLDSSPFTAFHTLVVPKHHYESVFDLPPEEMVSLCLGVKAVVDLLALKVGITDVQLLNRLGSAAQQDVFHVHFSMWCPGPRATRRTCGGPLTPSGGRVSTP